MEQLLVGTPYTIEQIKRVGFSDEEINQHIQKNTITRESLLGAGFSDKEIDDYVFSPKKYIKSQHYNISSLPIVPGRSKQQKDLIDLSDMPWWDDQTVLQSYLKGKQIESWSELEDGLTETLSHIGKTFEAQGYKAAETWHLSWGHLAVGLEEGLRYLKEKDLKIRAWVGDKIAKEGIPQGFEKTVYDTLENAEQSYEQSADYWARRVDEVGINYLDEFFGEFIGGAPAGLAEWFLNVPWAALQGAVEVKAKGENEWIGAFIGGAKRKALGMIFHSLGPFRKYLQSLGMGTVMGMQAAAEGGEIGKAVGTGALLPWFSPGSPGEKMGLNEWRRTLRAESNKLLERKVYEEKDAISRDLQTTKEPITAEHLDLFPGDYPEISKTAMMYKGNIFTSLLNPKAPHVAIAIENNLLATEAIPGFLDKKGQFLYQYPAEAAKTLGKWDEEGIRIGEPAVHFRSTGERVKNVLSPQEHMGLIHGSERKLAENYGLEKDGGLFIPRIYAYKSPANKEGVIPAGGFYILRIDGPILRASSPEAQKLYEKAKNEISGKYTKLENKDIGDIYYRSSHFNAKYGMNERGNGIFFGNDLGMVNTFGKRGEPTNIYAARLEYKKPYYMTWDEIESFANQRKGGKLSDFINGLKKEGYDAIVEKNEGLSKDLYQEPWQVAVFSESQIHPISEVRDIKGGGLTNPEEIRTSLLGSKFEQKYSPEDAGAIQLTFERMVRDDGYSTLDTESQQGYKIFTDQKVANISPKLIGDLYTNLALNGGITYDLMNGTDMNGQPFYSVSPYKMRERRIPVSRFSESDIKQYIADNHDLLTLPDHNFGGWKSGIPKVLPGYIRLYRGEEHIGKVLKYTGTTFSPDIERAREFGRAEMGGTLYYIDVPNEFLIDPKWEQYRISREGKLLEVMIPQNIQTDFGGKLILSGEWVLDVTKTVPNKMEAIRLMEQNGQESIYDLKNGIEISREEGHKEFLQYREAQMGGRIGLPGIPEGEPETKPRKFLQTVKESLSTEEQLRQKVEEIKPQDYEVLHDKEQFAKAEFRISTPEGVTQAIGDLRNEKISVSERGYVAIALMRKLQAEGDFERAVQVIDSYTYELTDIGRMMRTASLWSQTTPATFIRWAEKQLDKVNANRNWLDVKFGAKRVILSQMDKVYLMREKNRIDQLPNGVEKINANLNLIDFVAKKVPPGASELLDAFRYQNMLSGIQTTERNTGTNTMQTFFTRPWDIATRGMTDYVKSLLTGKDREYYTNNIADYYKAAFNSFPNASRAFIQAMKMQGGMGKPEMGIEAITEFERARAKHLPVYLTAVQRFMEGQDRFFSTIIAAGEKAANLKNGIPEMEAQARGEAMGQKYLFRNKMKIDTKELSVLSNVLEGLGLSMEYMRKVPILGEGAGWMIPFLRTPLNVGIQMIEHSPLTALRKPSSWDQEIAARFVNGSIVTGIGAMFANFGETTWLPPSGEEEKKWWYATGRKPFSIKVGEKWVPMWYLGPYALAFGLPTMTKYYFVDSKTALTDEIYQKFSRLAMGTVRFLASQTSTQSIGDLFALISGGTSVDLPKYFENTFGQIIPAQGFLRWMAKVIDPVYRQSEDAVDALIKNIPFWSKTLPAYEKPFKEESQREWWNAALPWDLGKEDLTYKDFWPILEMEGRLEHLERHGTEVFRKIFEKPEDAEKYIKKFEEINKKYIEIGERGLEK